MKTRRRVPSASNRARARLASLLPFLFYAAACGGTTEPPPPVNNGPFAIARFENVPTDTALDVTDDLVLPIRAIDSRGTVITNLGSLVTVASSDATIASASAVAGASTTIGGNAFGTATLTITASNAPVLGTTPVSAIITVKVRPHPRLLEFPTGAAHVEIYGVSDDGSVGGAAYAREGLNGAMAWRYTPGGGSQRLTNLGGQGDLSQVRGVAGDGTMVGYSSGSKTRWSVSGAATDLGAPGIAMGVNRSGAVIYYAPVSLPGGPQNQAFYRASNGDITALGTFNSREAIGSDLAEDGGVTGSALDLGVFYWTPQSGGMIIPTSAPYAYGNGIASGGKVVGDQSYGPGFLYYKGFYWSPTEGLTELTGFGTDEFVTAQDVSEAGLVVGSSMPMGTFDKPGKSRAYVWSKAKGYVDLTGTLPRATRAFAISNNGTFVAGTMESLPTPPFNTNQQPVLWLLRRP